MGASIIALINYLKTQNLVTAISFHAAFNFICYGIWNEIPLKGAITTIFYAELSDSSVSPISIILIIVTTCTVVLINSKTKLIRHSLLL